MEGVEGDGGCVVQHKTLSKPFLLTCIPMYTLFLTTEKRAWLPCSHPAAWFTLSHRFIQRFLV